MGLRRRTEHVKHKTTQKRENEYRGRRCAELGDMLKFSNRPPSAHRPAMCQHVKCAVTSIHTEHGASNHETLQRQESMLVLRSTQGSMDGLVPEKYKYETLHVSFHQFLCSCNYLRIIIVYNIYCSQLFGVSSRPSLLDNFLRQLAHRAAPQAFCPWMSIFTCVPWK